MIITPGMTPLRSCSQDPVENRYNFKSSHDTSTERYKYSGYNTLLRSRSQAPVEKRFNFKCSDDTCMDDE